MKIGTKQDSDNPGIPDWFGLELLIFFPKMVRVQSFVCFCKEFSLKKG